MTILYTFFPVQKIEIVYRNDTFFKAFMRLIIRKFKILTLFKVTGIINELK